MAKKQTETVKVKITAAVAFNGKVLPKDTVQEVSPEAALFLIENQHATEFTGRNAAGQKDEVVQ